MSVKSISYIGLSVGAWTAVRHKAYACYGEHP